MRMRLIRLLLILVLCCGMLAVPVGAEESANTEKENALDIKNSTVTDSLPQIDSVRWYQFTLENTADAVVRFTTEFEGTEYYYWQVTVYRAQDDSYVNGKGVGCRPVRDNDMLLANMKPGKYYVRVLSRHKGSPGSSKSAYTDAPYNIQVITEGYVHPTGDARRTTVSKAGEIIAVLGGKVYIKRNDGEAYVACYVTGKESGPILLGESSNAVQYYTPYITDSMWQFEKLEWEGKTYYYSPSIRDGYQGTVSDPSLYLCCDGQGVTGETAANDLLKLHFGTSPTEEKEKTEKSNTLWIVLAVVAAAALLAVFCVVCAKRGGNTGSGSGGSSYRGGSYGSNSYSGSSRVPTEQDLRDMEDMRIINEINKNLRTPGYEADGPSTGPGPDDFPVGPGPEDFPSSGSIW